MPVKLDMVTPQEKMGSPHIHLLEPQGPKEAVHRDYAGKVESFVKVCFFSNSIFLMISFWKFEFC